MMMPAMYKKNKEKGKNPAGIQHPAQL